MVGRVNKEGADTRAPTIKAFGIEDESNDYELKESLMILPFAFRPRTRLAYPVRIDVGQCGGNPL